MIHGYGNDISWTFQSTPIFLAHHGYTYFSLDLTGHDQSQCLKAFVPNLNAVIQDCVAFFDFVIKQQHYLNSNMKCFLNGKSMGGEICLLIHLLRDCNLIAFQFHGTVLVAPICKISNRIRPRRPILSILTFASRLLPTIPVIHNTYLIEKSINSKARGPSSSATP